MTLPSQSARHTDTRSLAERDRDELRAENSALKVQRDEAVKALALAIGTIQYCAHPEQLHPLNNSPAAVALNSLPELYAILNKLKEAGS